MTINRLQDQATSAAIELARIARASVKTSRLCLTKMTKIESLVADFCKRPEHRKLRSPLCNYCQLAARIEEILEEK